MPSRSDVGTSGGSPRVQKHVRFFALSPNCHGCTVKLDPVFVRELLQGLPADGEPTVSVLAKDKASAVVLRADSYTGVIMPLDPEA